MSEEFGMIKKLLWWIVGFVVLVSCISGGFYYLRVTGEKAIVHYEEFYEIQGTCKKISTDICNLQSVSDTSKTFSRISKEERLLALRNQLNRWVSEYNAKSQMITRNIWKSSDLPYTLSVQDFACH